MTGAAITADWTADDVLRAIDAIGLRRREVGDEWRAVCPACTVYPDLDYTALRIHRNGHLHCERGCTNDEIGAELSRAPARSTDKPGPALPCVDCSTPLGERFGQPPSRCWSCFYERACKVAGAVL